MKKDNITTVSGSGVFPKITDNTSNLLNKMDTNYPWTTTTDTNYPWITTTVTNYPWTTTTDTFYDFNKPKSIFISFEEVGETIEVIYKEMPHIMLSSAKDIVYKIIYSCVDGKWNKSNKIYGEITPAQEERYEF